jgi:hypothetical protein
MRKIIFFLALSLDARCWLSKSSDPFPCSKQYYMLCVSPLSFHIKILLYQHGQSALNTSRTLFLLASTQGVSCRLVMNHLIYVYVLSHIYVSKCMYVYVHISLFLPECACTTIRWVIHLPKYHAISLTVLRWVIHLPKYHALSLTVLRWVIRLPKYHAISLY